MSATAPDIRMSPLVQQLLDSDAVRKVLADALLAQARCLSCGQQVPPAGPVNVVVLVNPPAFQVAFAHLTCAPSAVMRDHTDLSELLPDESTMDVQVMLLRCDGDLLPVLVAARPLEAFRVTPDGTTDLLVSTLLREGMSLMLQVGKPPSQMLDWTATLTPQPPGRDLLKIESAPGRLFYEGDLDVAPQWWQAVQECGWCLLYSGNHLGRPDGNGIDLDTLRAAAAAGTLVGGRLPLKRLGRTTDPKQR